MASVIDDPNGRKRIQFVAGDGSRKTVRLGKASQRDAEQVCRHVEALAAATIHGQPVSRETAVWVSGIGDKLHDRLARAGLVKARSDVEGTKLGPFIDAYIASRTDVKPWTVVNLKRARKALVDHFGEGKPLAAITAGDADLFRQKLLGKGLAENTVRRICGRARQYFRAAIRRELIQRNPFDGIKCAVGGNPDRLYFVSREDAEKVLAATPDAEWRLIFALSRYGGMRCPSEHLALRWGDVDWSNNRMTVRSPKTEHYEGKASRFVPIFPELLPHLRQAFEAAEPGTEYVIGRCRDGGVNLRTQLERIIRRAGLQPWPKLFHNLRATRETELAEHFPLHVVCAWIGNSSAIAAKHYLQVTDEHFSRAVVESGPKKAAQNPAQQPHAGDRMASHDGGRGTKNHVIIGTLRDAATDRNLLSVKGMPPSGTEQPSNSAGKSPVSNQGGAESGAIDAVKSSPSPTPATALPDDLVELVIAWPRLAPAIRAGILAMVQAAAASESGGR